jgi:hypothetical protein
MATTNNNLKSFKALLNTLYCDMERGNCYPIDAETAEEKLVAILRDNFSKKQLQALVVAAQTAEELE